MPHAWKKLLGGLAALLASGAAIGWLYGRPEVGLLIAALGALGWQVYKRSMTHHGRGARPAGGPEHVTRGRSPDDSRRERGAEGVARADGIHDRDFRRPFDMLLPGDV